MLKHKTSISYAIENIAHGVYKNKTVCENKANSVYKIILFAKTKDIVSTT